MDCEHGPEYPDGTDAEGFSGGDRRMGLERRVAQVGGDHYQADYQHWHWVEDIGLGYLESNATKYLCRWQKKDGLKDLRKAQSYVNQLMIASENGRVNRVTLPRYDLFKRFCDSSGVAGAERDVCLLLWTWSSFEDLRTVEEIILHLIHSHFPETNQSRVASGPWDKVAT